MASVDHIFRLTTELSRTPYAFAAVASSSARKDAMRCRRTRKKVRDKVWDAKLNFKRNERWVGGSGREDDGDARVDIKE